MIHCTVVSLIALIPIASPLASDGSKPLKLYAATNGSDVWSGKLPAPNAAKTDGPFASIEKARDVIRRMKARGPLRTPVHVLLRGGMYGLKRPFALRPEDSGTAECPITYDAYPGEKPALSGGRRLTGWRRWRGNVWSCSLRDLGFGGLRFRQLFYGGERQTLARCPNRDPKRPRTGGFYYCDTPLTVGGKRQLRYPRRAFPRSWTRLNEVEVVIYPGHAWHNPHVPIASIDRKRRIITLSRPVGPIKHGNRFYIQNALEELDAPGEWYLDDRAGIVYFYPPDDRLADTEVVVPALANIVTMQGDLDQRAFVEHVSLSHLRIECMKSNGVVLSAAKHCKVIGCTVLKVGGTGIVLGAGSSHCRVAGNDVFYPGAQAIAMYCKTAGEDICTDNVITNNYAHHCGEITICSFGWGSGICISGRRNVVSQNLIHDTAYSALCFEGYDHVIEYNHVHHANLECKDGDGIYGWVNTKGGSGRNIVRFNRVHDVVGYCMVRPGVWRSPYYSLGIRADDYLSNTTIYGNLVYRASFACICLHGGWNNTVENNILVDGGQGQVRLPNMLRDRPSLSGLTGRKAGAPGKGKWTMSSNVVRCNVICYSSPDSAAYQCPVGWEDSILAEADWNLIWPCGRGPRVSIAGWPDRKTWARWVAGGRDAHSLAADPVFVDAGNDDYRLRPDSPAFSLGFKPLPIEKMGLIESLERASWPVREPKVHRDPPPPPPPSPPPAGMPTGRAYETPAPPTLDGRMPAEEWGGSAMLSRALIVERLSDGGVTPDSARVSALWDGDHLYIGIVNEIPDARAVELRVQAQSQAAPTGPTVLRALRSGRLVSPGRPGVKYASDASDKTWSCEWQIPFRSCGIDISRTDGLRFNVIVRRLQGKPSVAWFVGDEDMPDALLALSPSVASTARNLLLNGQFEDGRNAPTAWFTSERFDGPAPADAAKPKSLWAKEGRDGTRCLKLEALDAAAMTVSERWWFQTIKSPPPGAYVMTYDLRARDVRARGEHGRFYACGWAAMKKGVTPRGLNLGYTPENQIKQGSAPHWTPRECILDVPNDTQTLYILFGIKHATGTVWIDNCRLEKHNGREGG